MKPRWHLLLAGVLLLAGARLPAAERIPPAPPRYFNDYAGVVSRPVADRLNAQLEQFERTSSNQLLVVIYPRMESDSSVEDYTVRVAQAWKAGQAGKNNGAVLFSFMQEHQLYLQVGYGLEGVIPDATAKRIIEGEIVPRFRAGDIDGGMTAAVNAMVAATKGEYKGTGTTQNESQQSKKRKSGGAGFLVILIIIIVAASRRRRSALPYIIASRALRPGNSWWSGSGGGSSWGGGGGG
ncbi:MAG: TPM domain-containing protein, partial [Opitutus sp.]